MRDAGMGSVAWFEIGTTDAAATETFYGQLFGWRFDLDAEPSADGHTYGRISAPGAAGPMGAVDVLGRGDTDGSALGIVSADVDASVGQLEGLGATVVMPPAPAAGGALVAHVRDPQGNLLAVFSPPTGSDATPLDGNGATGGFARFEIGTTDMDASRRFYEQAFGWTFAPCHPPAPNGNSGADADADAEDSDAGSAGDPRFYLDILAPDGEPAGGLWDQSSGGQDFATFSILTDAMAPTAGRARKLGAKQLGPPNANPGGVVCARLLDPAGAQFGLVAFPRPDPDPDAEPAPS
jgi:predicted enzyme related to lactoylglutathione lyase